MSSPFVWFHHDGARPNDTRAFLETLLPLRSSPGPAGLTMLAAGDAPFAALGGERLGDRGEWIPFVAVDDVEAATARALGLGASLVAGKRRGPAGDFTVVREPGGAALALWKQA